jgi:arylsulfatase A-like enzyme
MSTGRRTSRAAPFLLKGTMQRAPTTTSRLGTLGLALVLGLAFLALSFIRIVGDAGSAAFGGAVINAAVGTGIWGTALGRNLLLFAAALVLVHVAFALGCLTLAALSRIAWPHSPHSMRVWLLLWFTLSAFWLLIANAALFPWSSLGSMYADLVQMHWQGINVFRVYSAAMLGGIAWLLVCALLQARRTVAAFVHRFRVPLIVTACVGLIPIGLAQHGRAPRQEQPHVILIGVDSLRNDAVETAQGSTPALDTFLHSAVRFTDATTPLARTFPSWVSIISGRNPHTTGAVINLLPRELIHTGETLPALLAKQHYTSVYAIDEVRFSNLDLSYGFDRMIAPPIGATDFMQGFFGDSPLSNLLANTRAGAVLFPYLHANRAIAHVYDPDSFIERLDRELDFSRPTFLAAHLTLPHWPYYWADAPQNIEGANDRTARRFYESAVKRVDRQFGDLMALLERRGALQNAVVIVISDHGESLGLLDKSSEDAGENPIGVEYQERRLVGHGTSVFAPSQYHVVFAMRSFGNSLVPDTPARIAAPVSLEDLTPTVLDLLSVQAKTAPFDGRSLAPLLSGGTDASSGFAQRVRFTETEFNPKGILPGATISQSAMEKAAAYYRVDPVTDRVLVRTELLSRVLMERQFAALKGNSMLAVVPIETASGLVQRAVLVESGQQPVVVEAPGSSERDDVRELWTALVARYPGIGSTSQDGVAAPVASVRQGL